MDHRDLPVLTHAFPTRRPSDLDAHAVLLEHGVAVTLLAGQVGQVAPARAAGALDAEAQADGRIVGGQEPLDAFQGSGCEMDRHGAHCSRCGRSEEHTSELQSLMRISYAVFCLKKKKRIKQEN